MSRTIPLLSAALGAALTVLLTAGSIAAQDKFVPDPLEPAPEDKVECDWSKLKKEEYAVCQDKKAFFAKMSPEEKKAYNERVRKDRIEARLNDLERRVEFLERTRR